jgi:hypothetical protein
MMGGDAIARIRFEHFQNGKGIKRIARELGIDGVFYKREVQPRCLTSRRRLTNSSQR